MSDLTVLAFVSVAAQAMAAIDAEGFSPQRAADICEALGGKTSYAHEPMPTRAANKLWRAYDFEDGSRMNVHASGCAVFEPGERWCQTLTDPSINLW